MRLCRALALLVLTAPVACGDDTSSMDTQGGSSGQDDTSTLSGDESSGGSTLGPGADCFEEVPDKDFGDPFLVNTCEFERPCNTLRLQCPGDDEDVDCALTEAAIEEPEDLDCILGALASGEQQAVTWGSTSANDPGWATLERTLWTYGTAAYFAETLSVDLSSNFTDVLYVELRPLDEFAECRDAETDTAKLECLINPWTDNLGVVFPGNLE